MSEWQLASGAIDDFRRRGFRSWPDPTAGFVQDIKVLACQDTWQAEVTMIGMAAAHWFWTNFIPSPVEITRKTLVGSYRCGFYFRVKFKSPIDVIFRAPGASKMLMEITNPVATGLFYFWAASTLFDAVNTWQSIIYAGMMCGLDHDECLLTNGEASAFAGGAPNGTPGFYHTLQDNRPMYTSPGGAVQFFERGWFATTAYGTVYNGSPNVTRCIISFQAGTTPLPGETALVDLGPIPPGNSIPFTISWEGYLDATAVRINWDIENDATGLQSTNLIIDRWTSSWAPEPWVQHCVPWPVRERRTEHTAHWWERVP